MTDVKRTCKDCGKSANYGINAKFCAYCSVAFPPTPDFKEIDVYLHGDKDDNWHKGEEMGLSEDAISENFKYTLYEVKVRLRVDMKTGKSEILAVDDREFK